MKYVKVEGSSELVRDVESHAILNVSESGYTDYINKRNLQLYQRDLVARQNNEIQTLKNDVSEIKQMLMTLMNK